MLLRVWGLMLRHIFLYIRLQPRSLDLFFWPLMNLLVWGFVTTYMQQLALPKAALFFLGAIILWDVFYRSQLAITLSITEEVWVRNIINIFIAPIRLTELVAANCLVGLLKAVVTTSFTGLLAYLLYAFDIFTIGPALLPFFLSLMIFGWALGLATMALILRFGSAAEAMIWGVPFLIQPISAVFYPVSVLPGWLQTVALLLPSTHVFEGLRLALATGQVDLARLWASLGLNLIYLVLGGIIFGWMLGRVRHKGYLTRQQMD